MSVRLERDGRTLVVTLDRPQARNAIDLAMALEVAAALDELDADPGLTIGVLTGAGGTFSSGMDLKAFLATGDRPEVEGRGLAGLTLTPPDYLQGETVRILYVHVPAAWLGMAGWAGIAAASVSQLVWRHPLSAIAGRSIAPAGATFALVCLATGSIWGRPTWGTWWEWDGRLTSMLILFFLYLGYIALASAEKQRGGEGRPLGAQGVAIGVLGHAGGRTDA